MGALGPHFFCETELMTDVAQDIWTRIEDYLGAEGLELDDLLVAGGSGAPALRVIVDGPEGVAVDHLADLSRALDRLLAETPYSTERYGLEVTSPGLERSLRLPKHWTKALGREVVVKTREPLEEARRHVGIVKEARASEAVLDIDGVERTIPYDLVTSAKTVFVWEKAPRPGKAAKEQKR